MDILETPREVDPGVLLLEEIHRTAGIIEWLERKIASLDEETEFIADEVTVTTEEGMSGQGSNVDTTKTETKKVVTHWWGLLEAERKHLANVTAAAIRSGIEERRVRLAERSVNALEAAMAFALMELGLDPHNERVRSVIGSSLRKALETGEASGSGLYESVGEEKSLQIIEGAVASPMPEARPVEF